MLNPNAVRTVAVRVLKQVLALLLVVVALVLLWKFLLPAVGSWLAAQLPLLTVVALLVLFVECAYLTLARCYQTGFLGSLGLGTMALVSGSVLLETYAGVEYLFIKQVAWFFIGCAAFMTQHVYRVVVSAVKRRRKEDDAEPWLGERT